MRVTLTAIIAFSWVLCQTALAQHDYPSKPIRIIVPFTPGGINDFAARSVSDGLIKALNVPVVVDNRPGAGGIIGTEHAAKAPPDGYTVIVGSVATHAIIQNLHKNPPYNVMRDFVAVTMIVQTPLIVVVHPSLPVKSVKELISISKSQPRRLNYASSGVGTATHLAAELFKTMANKQLSITCDRAIGEEKLTNGDETDWKPVATTSDLDGRDAINVVINDTPIALYKVGDSFYATSGICTHAEAQLCDGYVEGEVIECPLHASRFHIPTGKALSGPATQDLKVYSVKVKDNSIFIHFT